MTQQCQNEIDLVPSDELVGRKAHLELAPEKVGHILCVVVKPGVRMYTVEWVHDADGSMHSCDLYGFQLVLED